MSKTEQPKTSEKEPCPLCGDLFETNNGNLLSDMDFHLLDNHGGRNE